MKKVLYSLLIILALNTPALAWTHLAFVNGGPATTTSPRTVNAWSSAQPGMTMIMACGDVLGGTLTPVATSNPWTQLSCTGSALPVGAGTYEINYWTRTVGTSEPSTFGATFGDGGHTGCWIGYIQASDGTTPAIDACRVDFTSSSSGSITNGALSTVTNNDFILGLTMGAFGLNGFSNQANPYATEWAGGIDFVNASWNTGGFGTAGALPLVQYGFSASGSPQAVATIAFKNNTTTAVNFIGRGTQTSTGGSPATTLATTPTNQLNGNVHLASVTQNAGTLGTINIPGDIATMGAISGFGNNNVNSYAMVVDANAHAGNTEWVIVNYNTGTITPPSPTAGENAYTRFSAPVTGVDIWKKVLVAADLGQSQVWANSGTRIFGIAQVAVGSLGGNTITPGTLVGTCSGTTTGTATTTNNHDLVLNLQVGPSGTFSAPVGGAVAFSLNGGGAAIGWYYQATAGTTPNVTFPSGNCAYQLPLDSGVSTTTWTSLGNAQTTGATKRIDGFYHVLTSDEPTQWLFGLNGSPTTVGSEIFTLANLNTTTPFDVVVTEGDGANSTPIYPTITPTSADEAIFGISTLGGQQNSSSQFWLNTLSGQTNLGAQMNPLTLATGWPVTNQAPFNDGAQIVVGCNAATAPSLGASHICANQAGYDLFANALITPPAGSQSVFGYVAQ